MARVAADTLQAARAGLERAKEDPGLVFTVFLLTQIALASRRGDWQQRLAPFGVRLNDDADIVDLAAEIQGAVDDRLVAQRHRSDVGEIAQRAAGEALTTLTADRAETLFGNSGEELRFAVRKLSTKSGFAELGQVFFGRFMSGFLNFYLSRLTAAALGSERLQQIGDITAFNQALATHCRESARIVRDFAGQWFAKTEFERGISLANTAGFVAVALSKLQEELRRQRQVIEPPSSSEQGDEA